MFIIIKGEQERYILYFRASSTFEVIAAVDGKEKVLDALRNFCSKFNSRREMERFINGYQSSNTKSGIKYSLYNNQLEEYWNSLYKDVWEEKIQEIISSCFPKIKFAPKRKKFKVVI